MEVVVPEALLRPDAMVATVFKTINPELIWRIAFTTGEQAAKSSQRAAAAAASMFLDKLVAEMSFKVEAIEVDGGSEFMAELETACQQRELGLYVLPPKSPHMNGGMERCNGA
jgi:hypothetical protein